LDRRGIAGGGIGDDANRPSAGTQPARRPADAAGEPLSSLNALRAEAVDRAAF
jgi:hypothetical protein